MSYAGDVLRAAAEEMPETLAARDWLVARAHYLDGRGSCSGPCPVVGGLVVELARRSGLTVEAVRAARGLPAPDGPPYPTTPPPVPDGEPT